MKMKPTNRLRTDHFISGKISLFAPALIVLIELQSIYVRVFSLDAFGKCRFHCTKNSEWDRKFFFLENAITAVFRIAFLLGSIQMVKNEIKLRITVDVVVVVVGNIFCVVEHASYQTLSCQTSTVPVEKSAMQFIWFVCVCVCLPRLTDFTLISI